MGFRDRLTDIRDALRPIYADPPGAGGTAVAVSGNGNGAKADAKPLDLDHETLEGKALINLPRSAFFLLGGDREANDDLALEKAYAASVLAYAAITYRASKIAEPPLYVSLEDEEGEARADTAHALRYILEEPNPDQDMGDFLEETSTYLDTGGRALWVKTLDGLDDVNGLRVFRSDEFSVEADARTGRLHGKFTVYTKGGPREFEPERVVFFRSFNPNNRLAGLAPLDVALDHINIAKALKTAVRSALRNAAMLGSFFSVDGKLDETQFERLQAQIANRYSGSGNAGKPFLGEEGLKHQRGGFNLQELATGDTWREVEAAVCMAFKVRPEVLGALIGLENAPWSHMDRAQRLSYDEAIIPAWSRFEKTISRGLLPIEERRPASGPRRWIRFDTAGVRALQDDDAAQASVATANATIWSLNERRTYTGKEPVDDPAADEIPELADRAQAAAMLERLAAGLSGTATDEDEEEEGSDEDEAAEDEPKRLEWKARRQSHRVVFETLTRAQEAGLEFASAAALESDRIAIVRLAERYLEDTGKSVEHDVEAKAGRRSVTKESEKRFLAQVKTYLEGESRENWESKLRPLIVAGAIRAGDLVAGDVGIELAGLRDGLLEYAEREVGWLVKEISGTTRENVAAAVKAGLREGEGSLTIARRIQADPSGAFNRDRAKLVARTETTRVTNGAPRAALSRNAKETGRQFVKTWVAVIDERTRDEHIDLDGEQKAVDEEFSNGSQAPDEPNCRCSLIYSAVEAV